MHIAVTGAVASGRGATSARTVAALRSTAADDADMALRRRTAVSRGSTFSLPLSCLRVQLLGGGGNTNCRDASTARIAVHSLEKVLLLLAVGSQTAAADSANNGGRCSTRRAVMTSTAAVAAKSSAGSEGTLPADRCPKAKAAAPATHAIGRGGGLLCGLFNQGKNEPHGLIEVELDLLSWELFDCLQQPRLLLLLLGVEVASSSPVRFVGGRVVSGGVPILITTGDIGVGDSVRRCSSPSGSLRVQPIIVTANRRIFICDSSNSSTAIHIR